MRTCASGSTSVSPSVGALKTTSGGGTTTGTLTTRLGLRLLRRRLRRADGGRLDADERRAPRLHDAGHLEPAPGVDAVVDVEIEAVALRATAGHPDRGVGRLQDEIPAALARTVGRSPYRLRPRKRPTTVTS